MNPLAAADYSALERCWLTREIVDAAKVQRVDTVEGARIIGKTATASKNYAGLIFPYFWPGHPNPREYRLRRDNPDMERRPDGSIKEKNKYLSPPGRGNYFYFPPDTPAEWLTDASVPATITEGEKKALALWRFYQERGEKRLVIGIPGVWNWRGTVGKTMNANGKRQSVSGVIADFDRTEWQDREVLEIFDVNVLTDESVAAARRELGREVHRRGAIPSWVNLPTGIAGVNGVDDLLAIKGPDFFAGLLAQTVTTVTEIWEAPTSFYEFKLPSFPTEAFPSWLRAYVEGLAIATQTPIDLTGILTLAALAAAVARNVRVELRKGWCEPLNLYVSAALLPGNRKSAVIDEVTRPLNEYERELVEGMAHQIAEARSDYKVLEARLEKAQKDCAKLDGDELNTRRDEARKLARDLADFIMPVEPQLICDDVTAEALATLLVEQGARMALFSAEGGIFDIMAGRYSNGAANFDVYLKAHSGDMLRVNRRNRAEYLQAPALTMALAMQPEVVRGLAGKPGFRGRGLIGRFLYALPPSNLGKRKIRANPLNDETRNTYSRKLTDLARIRPVRNDREAKSARLIWLSREADDYLAAFEEELEPMLGEDGELGSMSDWGGKLAGAVGRIAGLLHLAENIDRLTSWPSEVGPATLISAETFKRAAVIGRWLIPHAKAAYAEMGADPEIEDARKLLRWIESEKSAADSKFTKRDAHRANHNSFPKVGDLEPALKLLEAHGYIRATESQRRDSQNFEINPALWAKKYKIDSAETSDSSDSSMWISEQPLTNQDPTVTTVTGFDNSDSGSVGNGKDHYPVEPEPVAPKPKRKQVSI
jgi:replicative DNA helicase